MQANINSTRAVQRQPQLKFIPAGRVQPLQSPHTQLHNVDTTMGDVSVYGYVLAISGPHLATSPGSSGESQLVSKTRACLPHLLVAAATMHVRVSDRQVFTDIMLGVFVGVTGHIEPNFRGIRLTVPTNLNLDKSSGK